MPLSPIRRITSVEVEPMLPGVEFKDGDRHPELVEGKNLDFSGVETQYSTHAIHPYVAAINPPLARAIIDHFVPRREAVMDPFCGGGGVLVEAILSGRGAEGFDINPLSVLLSRVKTTHLPLNQIMRVYQRVYDEALASSGNYTDDVPDLIRFWYADESIGPLCALRASVNRIASEPLRELFQAVLSATARDVMLTYRGEVRLRKLQGRDLERFRPNVFQSFRKRAELAAVRISELPKGSYAEVRLRDARQIGDGRTFHTVVTSPPYADDTNGVGYFQFSRNMLYWIGCSLEALKEQRRAFLGCGGTRAIGVAAPPSQTLADILAVLEQRNLRHHGQALHFYRDYYDALAGIAQVTKKRAIIITGDRVLSRTHINNGHITTEFMDSLGFGLEHYYTREIRKKRIPNLGGDGGGTAIEHILVYRQR